MRLMKNNKNNDTQVIASPNIKNSRIAEIKHNNSSFCCTDSNRIQENTITQKEIITKI
jgi:hypothetical protein